MVYAQKQNKLIKKITSFILVLVFCLAIFSFPAISHAQTEKKFEPTNPIDNLQVKIPGIEKLSQQYSATCGTEGKNSVCSLPYIAIYIRGIFAYSMGIMGILAAISIMIGGIIYMTSAGNATRITTAKTWIGSSIAGMVIGLSSYTLLSQVNPDLVGLKSIKIGIVQGEEDTTEAVNIGNIDESGWTFPQDPNIINEAGSQKMSADMAEKLLLASKCMKTAGYKIRVTSASRSVEKQKQLYKENCGSDNTCVDKSKCLIQTCCPFKAGAYCPHTSGAAIDVWGYDPNSKLATKKSKAAQLKLQDCMEQNGFCLLASECWHFEFPKISSTCGSGTNLNGGHCAEIKN